MLTLQETSERRQRNAVREALSLSRQNRYPIRFVPGDAPPINYLTRNTFACKIYRYPPVTPGGFFILRMCSVTSR